MKVKILKTPKGQIVGYGSKGVQAIDKLRSGVHEIEILTESPTKPSRSALQNRYYWGVVLHELVEECQTGLSAEDYHFVMKCGYFNIKKVGDIVLPDGDTKSLDTVEMETYLEHCRRVAQQKFNVYIPLPNEAGMDWGQY